MTVSKANVSAAEPSAKARQRAEAKEKTTQLDDELRELVNIAVDAAEDKLGQRTNAFFVGDILGITDWFVITSGSNQRQVRAIVDNVEEMIDLHDGPKPIRVEGKDSANWVLMDYGSFVVHVFDDESREYYDLERLWGDVPRLRESA